MNDQAKKIKSFSEMLEDADKSPANLTAQKEEESRQVSVTNRKGTTFQRTVKGKAQSVEETEDAGETPAKTRRTYNRKSFTTEHLEALVKKFGSSRASQMTGVSSSTLTTAIREGGTSAGTSAACKAVLENHNLRKEIAALEKKTEKMNEPHDFIAIIKFNQYEAASVAKIMDGMNCEFIYVGKQT